MKQSLCIMLMVTTIIVGAFVSGNAQTAPDLGTAAGFVLYTSAGEFANSGSTTITGDIGNGTGAITGDDVLITGSKHFGDSQGVASTNAVSSAYAQLTSATLNPCRSVLTSPMGANAVLSPGVYCSTTATVLTGDLILDGKNIANAKFIIKIDGALSVNAPVNIKLTGGALLENIYWQVNGAFNLSEGLLFKGTVVNNGAVNLASGASISGRVLSTGGKISLNNNIISNNEIILPVTLSMFMVKSGENESAVLNWTTTSEISSDRFEIEHSTTGTLWEKIASVNSKGESHVLVSYTFTDAKPKEGNNLYRLKMIDKDETYAYSRIRNVDIVSPSRMFLYPNPGSDIVTLDAKDISKIQRVEFNDTSGKSFIDQKKSTFANVHADYNIKNFPSGLYTVRVTYLGGFVKTVNIVKR
jgi:hypothetical protein